MSRIAYSVIVCSVDAARTAAISRHYAQLFDGVPHELIVLPDAKSLAEAYNRGIARAQGEVLVFSHDDVEFLRPDTWLQSLERHLECSDVLGVAGTSRLIGPAWAMAGPPFTFGRVGEPHGSTNMFRMLCCGVPGRNVAAIQAVDGLFIAARRKVVEQVGFDAAVFDGFHAYDIDFSYSAFRAGFRVAVATDLAALHYSQGEFGGEWKRYAERFMAKHGTALHRMHQREFQHGLVVLPTRAELIEALTYDCATNPCDTQP